MPPTGYAAEEPTHAPPWHGLVVWDVLFNALTTGLFLTAAIGELVRPAALGPVAVWAYPLALVLLLADLVFLVLDLGDPLRFHHMLRVFKPSSPMSLGTWCLTCYSLPLTVVVALDLFGIGGPVRPVLLVTAIPFAFGSMAYKGVLFSTSAQPGWKDARWLGAYHTASAFALGAVVLAAIADLTVHPARGLRLAAAGLLVGQAVPLLLLMIELWPGLGDRYPRWELVLTVAAAVGIVAASPLVLIEGVASTVLAAVFAVVGAWVVRRLIVALPHHP